MLEMVTFELLVSIFDHGYTDPPQKAIVNLDKKIIEKILHLKKVIKKKDLCEISFYNEPEYVDDYIDEYGTLVQESWDKDTEYNVIKITQDGIYWGGFITNTQTTIETDTIPHKTLEEILLVMKCNTIDLPLLINTLKSNEALKLFETRLKRLEK